MIETSRRNNLDVVRLFAASLVVFSHSFVLLGQKDPGMLWQTPGAIGVYIFFAVSGYLIAKSWDADPHLGRFLTRRILRIFPALAACILLSVLLLGPALTRLPLRQYFASVETWDYLHNIVLKISYHLPGVFELNPYPGAVNGSLWSLPVEFVMYLLVAAIGITTSASRWAWIAAFAAIAFLCELWAYQAPLVAIFGMDVRQLAISGIYFIAGACFFKFDLDRFFSTTSIVIALLLLQGLMAWPWIDRLGSWILLPWVVLGFGLQFSKPLGSMVKYGDFSYGMYVYAFPIQQVIVHYFPRIEQPVFFVVSLCATMIVAVFSWHLIEKPALSFKPKRQDG
jgi:peptidoglycan/LPS O-acetylase OafA/YrhL